MLSSTGWAFMEQAPWLATFPGLAISLAVLAFNLFGDILSFAKTASGSRDDFPWPCDAPNTPGDS